MMGAITIFEENNTFIFSFVVLGLVTKSVWARCTFEEVTRENKM
jgi:hypothetical protein